MCLWNLFIHMIYCTWCWTQGLCIISFKSLNPDPPSFDATVSWFFNNLQCRTKICSEYHEFKVKSGYACQLRTTVTMNWTKCPVDSNYHASGLGTTPSAHNLLDILYIMNSGFESLKVVLQNPDLSGWKISHGGFMSEYPYILHPDAVYYQFLPSSGLLQQY